MSIDAFFLARPPQRWGTDSSRGPGADNKAAKRGARDRENCRLGSLGQDQEEVVGPGAAQLVH